MILIYFLYFTKSRASYAYTQVKASLPVSVTDFHFVIPGLIDHVLLV